MIKTCKLCRRAVYTEGSWEQGLKGNVRTFLTIRSRREDKRIEKPRELPILGKIWVRCNDTKVKMDWTLTMLYVQCFPFYLQNDLRMNAMVFLFSDEVRICFLKVIELLWFWVSISLKKMGSCFWTLCCFGLLLPISGFACCYSTLQGYFPRR